MSAQDQMKSARDVAKRILGAENVSVATPQEVKAAMATFFAMTEGLADEVLAAEASRYANQVMGEAATEHDVPDLLETMRDPTDEPSAWGALALAYIAGARREGRR
jgi:hypothetical protein